MEKEHSEFELNLNRITIIEQLKHPNTFLTYRKEVSLLLNLKQKSLSEHELLNLFHPYTYKNSSQETNNNDTTSIESILSQYPHVIKGANLARDNKGIMNQTYFDLETDYIVMPDDFCYDKFFVRKLRQVDLIDLQHFLEFHLEKYYNSNKKLFVNFLKLAQRKHQAEFSQVELSQTVNELMVDVLNSDPQNSKTYSHFPKRQLKRDANDKLTALNLEQTVLLISYLQKEKIILPDSYLSDKTISQAFELLTGYSQHTIRQSLGQYINFRNKINLKQLDILIDRLKYCISGEKE